MYNMNKIRKLRKENALSVYDMAALLGITAAYYSQLENKKRRLFYDMAIKLAAIFEMHPDELFYPEEAA